MNVILILSLPRLHAESWRHAKTDITASVKQSCLAIAHIQEIFTNESYTYWESLLCPCTDRKEKWQSVQGAKLNDFINQDEKTLGCDGKVWPIFSHSSLFYNKIGHSLYLQKYFYIGIKLLNFVSYIFQILIKCFIGSIHTVFFQPNIIFKFLW